jgi:hypothetical protein
MKREVKLLPQVHIASPCPAAWEEMRGDDRSRFCGECKLNVYNLSDMSADEAEAFLTDATGRVCVRYYRRADGTVMTRDCPRGLAAARKRFARVLTTATVLVLAVGFAVADGIRGTGSSEGTSRLADLKEKLEEVPAFAAILDKIDPPRTVQTVAGRMTMTWNPKLFGKPVKAVKPKTAHRTKASTTAKRAKRARR